MYLQRNLATVAPPVGRLPLLRWWAGVSSQLWSRAQSAARLRPVPTKPSDNEGLLVVGSSENMAGCVQTFSSDTIEWYSVSTVAADPPGFGTITTVAAPAAHTDVPNLMVQAVPMGPEKLLLYISLQPRTDAPANLDYLRRYFQSSPPALAKPQNGSSSAESAPADASPVDGNSAADANGAAVEGSPSYHALQQRCWKLPGWAHYRSRSLEMNLMGAGLDIFGTLPASEENLAAVEEVCLQAMDLWLAFLADACKDGGEAGGQSAERSEAQAGRDAALRQLLLHDPDTAMAERLFGAEPMRTMLKVVVQHPDVLL
ncbi:hypothetical protein COHA_008121 [Chlorella ohadii]|uniref:Red chlorophyll catabolite reductase n=1 Tax=Chlorella ohadii TaxID=2649997 RepID=A0AAD5GZA7_9CHLO|nr:hypothetical protein COHA_008121 [Chlorella ohadii]